MRVQRSGRVAGASATVVMIPGTTLPTIVDTGDEAGPVSRRESEEVSLALRDNRPEGRES